MKRGSILIALVVASLLVAAQAQGHDSGDGDQGHRDGDDGRPSDGNQGDNHNPHQGGYDGDDGGYHDGDDGRNHNGYHDDG